MEDLICGVPFALTITVVALVWAIEAGQALRLYLSPQKKALQERASSLRSAISNPMPKPASSAMTVPPGRA